MIDLIDPADPSNPEIPDGSSAKISDAQHVEMTVDLISDLYQLLKTRPKFYSDKALIAALSSLLVWCCNKTKCERRPLLDALEREIKQ